MRVLHYRDAFSKLSETFIYEYVTELERQGINNHVVTHERLNSVNRPFGKVHIVKGVSRWNIKRMVRRIGFAFKNVESKGSLSSIKKRRLKEVINRVKPDIIHAHFGLDGVRIAKVADSLGVPLVTSFYGFDISRLTLQNYWVDKYLTLLNKKGNKITVLSEQMKKKLVDIGIYSNLIEIIHLSRDINKLDQKKISYPVRKFVSVGRLTPKKGHFDTIDAFKRIIDEGYEVELDIIGDGKLKDELQSYIDKKGVGNVIRLVGSLPNDKVIEALHQSDAFILSSKTAPSGDMEGTPTVFVEAQAIGLPCISTYHAGIPEMIPEENHYLLANEGEVSEIAASIKRLIQSNFANIQRIVNLGRKKIKTDFNLSNEVRNLIELYKQTAR